MRTIAHISDPHFGTEDAGVAAALLHELTGVTATTPSVVVVSGDLTQRARPDQFRAARAFLDQIAAPVVVVPGNHDIPLFDVVSRFFHPLRRYGRHVSNELMPTYLDDQLVVVGLTTAHGFTLKNGRVTRAQAIEAAELFADMGDRFKVLVAHHPFVLPAGRPERERVDGAAAALPILEAAGVEVICTGHLHASFASDTAGFRNEDRAIVAVHAGTCISTRRRGEANAYNRLRIDGDRLGIRQRVWDGARFVDGAHKSYERVDGRWRHAPDLPDARDALDAIDAAPLPEPIAPIGSIGALGSAHLRRMP